nr:RNA-directed DNA polymerase, eukaryota [Tanacetum cinerariifolium]
MLRTKKEREPRSKKGDKSRGKAAYVEMEISPIPGLSNNDYQTFLKHFSRTARYSAPNLVGQRPDGIAYVAAVQQGYFAPLAELGYFYDLTTLYRSEPNRLLHILHVLMLRLQTTGKEHVNRLAQQYPSFAQTAVFSKASQQPLEVEWASYIQTSIPQAHMPCDDDVQHNAVVKDVVDCSMLGVTQSLQNPSTGSVFIHTEDDLALKHKFLRLYALDNCKQITVVEKINHASMVDIFVVLLEVMLRKNNSVFLSRVDGLTLTNIPDCWVWSLEANGEFSVKFVRQLIDDSILPNEKVVTWWVKIMPIKINVFAWRVCLNKNAHSVESFP